jgi:hypothetical protein
VLGNNDRPGLPREIYGPDNLQSWPYTETTDLTGSLQITRTGDLITYGYRSSPTSGWQTMLS